MAKTRPSIDDPGVLEEVCRRITRGHGIYKVCRSHDMPSKDAVYERMAVDDRVATAIARAREAQQDALVDQMNEIMEAATPETWQVARARVWMMQWTAMKLSPKKYGAVTTMKHGGEEGGAIPVRFEAISDGQLNQFIERLERAASAVGAERGEGGEGPPPEASDQ